MQHLKQSPPRGEEPNIFPDAITRVEGMGICVVDLARKEVVFQNDVCERFCGKHRGIACSRKQFRFCETGNPSVLHEGVRLSACEAVNKGGYFDVVAINDGKKEVLHLYPLDKRLRREEALFDGTCLTDKEGAIVHLLVRRHNNRQICAELEISDNTLRTHLKNIYRKVSPLGKKLLVRMRKGT